MTRDQVKLELRFRDLADIDAFLSMRRELTNRTGQAYTYRTYGSGTRKKFP